MVTLFGRLVVFYGMATMGGSHCGRCQVVAMLRKMTAESGETQRPQDLSRGRPRSSPVYQGLFEPNRSPSVQLAAVGMTQPGRSLNLTMICSHLRSLLRRVLRANGRDNGESKYCDYRPKLILLPVQGRASPNSVASSHSPPRTTRLRTPHLQPRLSGQHLRQTKRRQHPP